MEIMSPWKPEGEGVVRSVLRGARPTRLSWGWRSFRMKEVGSRGCGECDGVASKSRRSVQGPPAKERDVVVPKEEEYSKSLVAGLSFSDP